MGRRRIRRGTADLNETLALLHKITASLTDGRTPAPGRPAVLM